MFMTSKYALKDVMKRSYRSASTMSKAGLMFAMILFLESEYRCLKQFYIGKTSSMCPFFNIFTINVLARESCIDQ